MSSYRIASLLRWVLMMTTFPLGKSLSKMYAFPLDIDFRMLELTGLSDRLLTRRSPFGSIVARLQTLHLATAAMAWYSQ